jgi:O-antigen/teichoic acid export membrane protein
MAMYLKTIVSICVGLFTTRYVLEALGLNDFGIFGLVGSVIGLLEFLNSTMTGATQRFLSYHRKREDLNSVFTASVILHFLIGVVVVILLEIGGFLFLDMLNIPDDRRDIAHFVFHCVVATTFFSIISTPYQALINANEDMFFMAVISIAEVFAKLGIAFFLFASPYDRLGTYAVGIMALAVLMRIIQRLFCKMHYPNVVFSYKSIDRDIMRKMLAFSGWNFFVNISIIFRTKGTPILVNLFFGTAMNAVYNLASQVTAQISTFSFTLSQASAPQIVSGTADENLDRPKMLAVSSCKFQLFLASLLGTPLILNIDYVLLVWLKQVPEFLQIFCCLAIANEMMLNLSRGLQSLIEGKGYIRGYKIAMGFSNFIPLPIAYIFLKLGYPPYSIYIALLALPIFANIFRIYFAKRHVALSVPHFLKEMSKILAVVLVAFFCTWLAVSLLAASCSPLVTLLLSTSLSSTLMCSGLWLALDAKERAFAKGVLGKVRGKLTNP